MACGYKFKGPLADRLYRFFHGVQYAHIDHIVMRDEYGIVRIEA